MHTIFDYVLRHKLFVELVIHHFAADSKTAAVARVYATAFFL
jgi:predicted protein tyrosine phosphatase